MLGIKVISFDLDDTLWDAEPVLRRAEEAQFEWIRRHCPQIADRHDINSLYELRCDYAQRTPDVQHDFSAIRKGFFTELLSEFGYDGAMVTELFQHFLSVRSDVKLHPDVEPTLLGLREQYHLAAMTNGNTDLRRAGIDHYFHFVISPADTGASKPDVRMFEHLFACSGAEPAEIIHVGDQPYHDIEGAHRAGVHSVWVNRCGSDWPPEYRQAHAEIGTLTELPSVINELMRQATGED